jgi:hypothetical protein
VLVFAPRMPQRLLDEIERQSRRREPIAEINRRVGAAAVRMSLYRPSYEQVRVLVHTARRLRRAGPQSVSTLALDVAFRVKPPHALVDRLGEGRQFRLGDRAPPPK